MTENSPGMPDDAREASVDRALAENQQLERDERDHDLARQQTADERIVRALSKE